MLRVENEVAQPHSWLTPLRVSAACPTVDRQDLGNYDVPHMSFANVDWMYMVDEFQRVRLVLQVIAQR